MEFTWQPLPLMFALTEDPHEANTRANRERRKMKVISKLQCTSHGHKQNTGFSYILAQSCASSVVEHFTQLALNPTQIYVQKSALLQVQCYLIAFANKQAYLIYS